MAPGPRLVVAAGSVTLAAIELRTGPVTIGWHPACVLVVNDPHVSGQHARVCLQGRLWVLVDLASSIGMFLQDVRIQRQALRPGDQIVVGQTVIRYKV